MKWLLWPFETLFYSISGIIKFFGRLVAVVIGLVLVIMGLVICATVIGAIIGVPIIIFGVLLMIRGFFK